MTVRLPVPGSDAGNWGDILNAFLLVAHNSDGSLISQPVITGAEQVANKGVANGYAGLDGTGLVPDSELAVPLSKVGDYIGLEMYTQAVPSEDGMNANWDQITASRGSSLSWSSGNTVAITDAGVYAIHVMAIWNDSTDRSGSTRMLEVAAACGFFSETSGPSASDGQNTTQALEFTAYLQAGDDISVFLTHFSAAPTLPVDLLMLVTRLS